MNDNITTPNPTTRVPYCLLAFINNYNKKVQIVPPSPPSNTIPTPLISQSSFLKKQQDPIKQAIVSHCKILSSLYKTNKISRAELLEQLNTLFDKIWVDYNLSIIEKVPLDKITPLPKNFDTQSFLKDAKTLIYLLKNPHYLYTLYNNHSCIGTSANNDKNNNSSVSNGADINNSNNISITNNSNIALTKINNKRKYIDIEG